MNARSMPPLDEEFEASANKLMLVSYESESALIGSLLYDARQFDVVSDIVQAKDFADELHATAFGAISAMAHAGKAIDVITVHEHLQGRVELMALNDLHNCGTSSESAVRRYAEIVHERALSRQLVAVVTQARELAADHTLPIGERVDKVSAQLASLAADGPGDEWVSVDTGMDEFMADLDARCSGNGDPFLPTGLHALDLQLDGGMRPGELIIIGARPAMGKTALAMTIGMHGAKLGQTVAMFSLEMQRADLWQRQVAMEAEVPLSKIRQPHKRMSNADYDAVTAANLRLKRLPFYVTDRTGLNINTLRTKTRSLKRRHGLRLLIVDYLGLMHGTNPKDNRTTQLGEVTRSLKELAKELGITVLLLAQLNREVEKRVDQLPMLSDLRDCGEIEQDADIVLFPHRPIHLKPSLGPEWQSYATLRVAKQRAGATGDLHLRYTGPFVRFGNWHGEKPGTAPHRQDDDFE
ncbi:replicative DNA helicase [Comamonas sp.]|uniref:replicative DNA helicase n=1 Tax=Comamonas sp. TaxID=34028 RepID=UPI003A93590C